MPLLKKKIDNTKGSATQSRKTFSNKELKSFYANRGGLYIKLIAVIRKADREAVTFVSDCYEGEDYLETLCRKEHDAHYVAWCALHDCDYKQPESWEKYCAVTKCRDDMSAKYYLTPITYTLDQFSAIMRSVTGRMPIGAPYETPEEADYLKKAEDFAKAMEQSPHDFAVDQMIESLKNTLGISDQDEEAMDPVYSKIVDDTIDYLEKRLLDAGILTQDDIDDLHEDDSPSGGQA